MTTEHARMLLVFGRQAWHLCVGKDKNTQEVTVLMWLKAMEKTQGGEQRAAITVGWERTNGAESTGRFWLLVT